MIVSSACLAQLHQKLLRGHREIKNHVYTAVQIWSEYLHTGPMSGHLPTGIASLVCVLLINRLLLTHERYSESRTFEIILQFIFN